MLVVATLGDRRNIVLDGARGFDAAFAKLLWPLVLLSAIALMRLLSCLININHKNIGQMGRHGIGHFLDWDNSSQGRFPILLFD